MAKYLLSYDEQDVKRCGRIAQGGALHREGERYV